MKGRLGRNCGNGAVGKFKRLEEIGTMRLSGILYFNERPNLIQNTRSKIVFQQSQNAPKVWATVVHSQSPPGCEPQLFGQSIALIISSGRRVRTISQPMVSWPNHTATALPPQGLKRKQRYQAMAPPQRRDALLRDPRAHANAKICKQTPTPTSEVRTPYSKSYLGKTSVHTKSVSRPRGCRRQNAKTRKHENAKTPIEHENTKTRKRQDWACAQKHFEHERSDTALGMCKVCTEAVHSVALWTRALSQLWACVKYVPKQSIPWHFAHEHYHSSGHVLSMYRSSPFRSTRKPENGENGKTPGLKMWKHKNAKTAKTRKRRKRENVQSGKAVLQKAKKHYSQSN